MYREMEESIECRNHSSRARSRQRPAKRFVRATRVLLDRLRGHQAYQETGGRYLADERLLGVAAIASLRTSGRVLDLGCGRGELALYFASLGHEVTAVDYSRDAIDLAEKTFSGSPALRSRVDLLCENVGSLRLVGEYEIVVASDVIEHLSPGELDGLYEAVSHHLSSSGIFVTHTYPNLWFFQYDYVRKRRLAAQRHEF